MALKAHEFALLFPMMSSVEFDALKEDIKAHGLLEPIKLLDGRILDGRNREKACTELGIQVETEEYTGKDPAAYVVSRNIHRRHLTESQRAMIAGRLATLRQGRPENGKQTNWSISDAATALQVGEMTVKRARKVLTSKTPELVRAVEVGEIAVSEAATIASLSEQDRQAVALTKDPKERKTKTRAAKERAKKEKATAPATLELTQQTEGKGQAYYTVEQWSALKPKERAAVIDAGFEASASMTPQTTTSIEWAQHSLNTVTGCLHDCPYCYARDFAERYFPQKFVPVFHPARLSAPARTPVPEEAAKDPAFRNVFANSMSDLFGQWVPREWIEATIEMASRNRQWNFLTLTKFPQRAAKFSFPENWWMGTTVDAQARVKNAERAFEKIQCGTKWLSVEPLLEPLKFKRLDLFQWIVIGGASRSIKTPEWVPNLDWIAQLHGAAREAGLRIYYKTNCGMADDLRLREFPWSKPKVHALPKAFRYLKGMQ